jgi:hypothetical protein
MYAHDHDVSLIIIGNCVSERQQQQHKTKPTTTETNSRLFAPTLETDDYVLSVTLEYFARQFFSVITSIFHTFN